MIESILGILTTLMPVIVLIIKNLIEKDIDRKKAIDAKDKEIDDAINADDIIRASSGLRN